MLTEELIGKETIDMMPTDGELKTFIEKIAAFFLEFVKLFKELAAGITETFAGYERQL